MTDDKHEQLVEQLFDEREENKRLRGQITYLQEEVASLEDDVRDLQERLDRANNIEM